MEELAKRNSMSSAKAKSAAEQVNLSEGPRPTDNSSDIHDSDQPSNIGPIDQANSSLPSHSSVVESIERDDTPMHDAGSVHQAGEGSSSNIHERPSMAGHPQNRTDLSPEARGASESRDPELLASLDPSNDDEEGDGIVDGWGTLRRSTFVILQYGPRHGARYKAKYRNGYTNDDMNNISDRTLRISQLKDGPGNRSWRYTKHNVVGIYGVASEERKDPNKTYKSDPCVWLKIKWKNLKSEDTDKMQGLCSWIPRSDFVRFCNGKRRQKEKSKRSGINKKNATFACSRATLEEAMRIGPPPLAHWAQQRGNHLSDSLHDVSIHLQSNSQLQANMKCALPPMRICIRDRGRQPTQSTLTEMRRLTIRFPPALL